MRVNINRDECTSCAACWDEYPEIFEESEVDGLAQIVIRFRTAEDPGKGDIPDDMNEAAKAASEECPAEVILIEA